MSGTCGTNVEEERFMQGFGGERKPEGKKLPRRPRQDGILVQK
jgi:hypothetical protein